MTVHLDSLSTLAGARTRDDADVAATQLEAYFLRRMLSEMNPTQANSLFGGGFGEQMFKEMMDEALADAMSEAGGLGIADMLARDLGAAPTLTGVEGAPGPAVPPPLQFPGRARAAYAGSAGALSVVPVEGRNSSSYGSRVHPIDGVVKFHGGMDIAAPEGSRVCAAGPGKVVRAEKAGGYGNLVVVDHGGGLETRYAHLSAISVTEGQVIAPGDEVGRVGATGHATGPHLHFEVRRDGKTINPARELDALGEPAAPAREP